MLQVATGRTVSTWSLHRTLGRFAAGDSAVAGGPFIPQADGHPSTSLLELLPELAARGYSQLHICHFHLQSRDVDYLNQVRTALAVHGITLDMLLIDDGDLTAPDLDRQLAWYHDWLRVAEVLGAKRARISAGRANPTPDRLRASGRHMAGLAQDHPQARVVTENWLEMTPDATSTLSVLDAAGDDVGLLIDLGNWRGSEKYRELATIAPKAESCHAKCHFSPAGPDETDFRTGLRLLKDAGFDGPLALIYDGPDANEWAGLDREWDVVASIFGQPTDR